MTPFFRSWSSLAICALFTLPFAHARPPTSTSTTTPQSTGAVFSTTDASGTRNVTSTVYSSALYFGSGDVCSQGTCSPNTYNPWVTTSAVDSVTGQPVNYNIITQASARQSGGIPYLNFQFYGSAVYLYTVTTPSSTGVFNITVDGGITWRTVRPTVTTPGTVAGFVPWYQTGLNPNRLSQLVLRYWADADGPGLVGPDNTGSQLNVQAIMVTKPDDTSSTLPASTDNGSTATSGASGSSTTAQGVNGATHSGSSDKTGLIIGLAVGIPLLLILLVLLTILLICLRRRDRRSRSRKPRTSDDYNASPAPIRHRREKSDGSTNSNNVDMIEILSMGRDDDTILSHSPHQGVQRPLWPRLNSYGSSAAGHPRASSLEVPPMGVPGPSRWAAGRQSAERPSAETTIAPKAVVHEARAEATPSSGVGGSSGDQGDTSGGSDAVNADKSNPYGGLPDAARSAERISNVLAAVGSRNGSKHQFTGFDVNVINPPEAAASRSKDGKYQRSPRISTRSAPPIKYKNTNPATWSSRNLPAQNPKSDPPPPLPQTPANDADTTFRSLMLGQTPDMNAHSPIASTPEPMLGWEPGQTPSTPDINRDLSNIRVGPLMGTKMTGLGLATPATTIDPAFPPESHSYIKSSPSQRTNARSSYQSDSSSEDDRSPQRQTFLRVGRRRARTRSASTRARDDDDDGSPVPRPAVLA